MLTNVLRTRFGLPKIPSDLIGKAWQERAVKDVKEVLKELMGRDYSIVFVKNATSRAKDAEVTYNVQLTSVAESKQIRKKFGVFFHGGVDKSYGKHLFLVPVMLPANVSGVHGPKVVAPTVTQLHEHTLASCLFNLIIPNQRLSNAKCFSTNRTGKE